METPTSKITSKILYMKTRNPVSDSSLSIHPIEAQQKSIMLGSPIHSNKLSESVLDLVRARPNPANQIRNHPVGPNSRSYREDANPDLISSESGKPLQTIHNRARRAKGPIIPTFLVPRPSSTPSITFQPDHPSLLPRSPSNPDQLPSNHSVTPTNSLKRTLLTLTILQPHFTLYAFALYAESPGSTRTPPTPPIGL